jgi:NADH:ubiquinone oxidoreductase subunit K
MMLLEMICVTPRVQSAKTKAKARPLMLMLFVVTVVAAAVEVPPALLVVSLQRI